MLLAVSLVQTLADPPAGLSADEAMANYRHSLVTGKPVGRPCGSGSGSGDEIVVCGRDKDSTYRLPLPEERFGPGERVSHPSEPPPAMGAMGALAAPGEVSRQGETIHKVIGLLKGLITGEDPN